MRKLGFYPKLAAQTIKKNNKYYLPYFLTGIVTSAMFYIIVSLFDNGGITKMRGAEFLGSFLVLGSFVIGIFSVILMFYTNSFLMKRRRKELGIYNVLGMGKRHIAIIMLWETIYTSIIIIIGGIVSGIILSKLFLLLLCNLAKLNIPLGFEISYTGIYRTVIIYAVILLINLLFNIMHLTFSNPIELVRSENKAEKEPKTKWVMAILGIICIAVGYYMAITVKNPILALSLFFIAVILVIVGTYFLFIAGSIAFLKILRKKKSYYYKTNHFISVSGMLYRMKKNAAGLASICILSTMVLVSVSTTLSLYIGTQSKIDSKYPNDLMISLENSDKQTAEEICQLFSSISKKEGVNLTNSQIVNQITFAGNFKDGNLEYENVVNTATLPPIVCFISQNQYNNKSEKNISLENGEVLAMSVRKSIKIPETFTTMGVKLKVKDYVTDLPLNNDATEYAGETLCFAVNDNDMSILHEQLDKLKDKLSKDSSFDPDVYTSPIEETIILADFDCDEEKQISLYERFDDNEDFSKQLSEIIKDRKERLSVSENYKPFSFDFYFRAIEASRFYAMEGGFFFIGIFLGALFLMATVQIIYYKQISEGFEDSEKFKIMQQVGMSKSDVKKSIKSQILTVFFLPLITAGIHITAAFPMISKLLTLFQLFNTGLFVICCVSTFIVFAIVYIFIYTLTAKSYYRIVEFG